MGDARIRTGIGRLSSSFASSLCSIYTLLILSIRRWKSLGLDAVAMSDIPPPEPAPPADTGNTTNITNVSGGVNIGDSATIGGDVVGRDKITTVFTGDQQYDVHGLANPYLGLQSFTYADHAKYAGRERLIAETVARLTAPDDPLFSTRIAVPPRSLMLLTDPALLTYT
jgi:hypothetical protein